MHRGRGSWWWLLALVALLCAQSVGAAVSRSKESVRMAKFGGHKHHDGGLGDGEDSKEEERKKEEEIVARETQWELKHDGVKVKLKKHDDLDAKDNLTMKYKDGEVVKDEVPMDPDIETEEVGRHHGTRAIERASSSSSSSSSSSCGNETTRVKPAVEVLCSVCFSCFCGGLHTSRPRGDESYCTCMMRKVSSVTK